MKLPIEPRLSDLLNSHLAAGLNDLFVSLPGKIESYSPLNTTATVSIMMKQVEGADNIKSFPYLVDVPVMQLTGGTGGVNLPIAVGDPCLVVFADRNIDNWFATGSAEPPANNRTHSLADGFAIVGFRPQTNKVTRPDYNAASLYKDGTQVSVKSNKIAMKNPSTNMKALLDSIISAVNDMMAGMTVTAPNGPCTISYTFTPPTPGDLLYAGDETTPGS